MYADRIPSLYTHARVHQELEYLCIQISVAHRVGRLLAFLIEPFILALAYAHTARRRAYATRRDSPKRACVHTREYIDYRCFASPVPLASHVSPSPCVACRIGKLLAAIRRAFVDRPSVIALYVEIRNAKYLISH